MVERIAPDYDIRVRFLEPLFAGISADFFSYIPLRAASSGAPAPVAEPEYALDVNYSAMNNRACSACVFIVSLLRQVD